MGVASRLCEPMDLMISLIRIIQPGMIARRELMSSWQKNAPSPQSEDRISAEWIAARVRRR